MAQDELQAAQQFAREFRAGDSDAIGDQRERIESKLEAVDWTLTVE
jgi:hypothetical protein